MTINHAHIVIENYSDGVSVPVAIFWDGMAALEFAKIANDEAQADYVEIDKIPLIDNYGYPCKISDLPFIAPWTRCTDY